MHNNKPKAIFSKATRTQPIYIDAKKTAFYRHLSVHWLPFLNILFIFVNKIEVCQRNEGSTKCDKAQHQFFSFLFCCCF